MRVDKHAYLSRKIFKERANPSIQRRSHLYTYEHENKRKKLSQDYLLAGISIRYTISSDSPSALSAPCSLALICFSDVYKTNNVAS